MVLITTENVERIQHQLRRNPTSFVDGESKEIAVPQNSDNTLSSNNTTQTPGTRLTRLDAEMSRILNSRWPRNESERWKMYREALWRYLGLSEKRGDRKTYVTKTKMQKTTLHEMPPMITRRAMTFFTISREHPIYHRHHIPIVTQILQRKISKFRASIII